MVARCCLVNCSTFESKAVYPLLSFHRIPSSSNKSKVKIEWRKKLLQIVNRCDSIFNSEQAFICSRHYKPDCIKIGKKGRKDLIVGSLPTEFLPSKSIDTPKVTPRRLLIRGTHEYEIPAAYKYFNFQELKRDFAKIKPPWLILSQTEWSVLIGVIKEGEIQCKISVDESLEFSIHSGNQELPSDHFVYKKHKRNVSKYRIHWLLNDLQGLIKCPGIYDVDVKKYGIQNCSKRLFVLSTNSQGEAFSKVYSKNCHVLVNSTKIYPQCRKSLRSIKNKLEATRKAMNQPISLKAPLSKFSKKRLVVAVLTLRQKQKKLEARVNQLEQEISTKGVDLGKEMHSDLKTLVDNAAAHSPEDSFQNIFWREQKKYFNSSSRGIRWHPMMIRYALHLHLRSPSAYRALKESLVIKLPSERTLRDYSNIAHPSVGFSKSVFDDLKHQSSKLEGIGKYMVVMFDEVSVRDDLVFDKNTGDLIGFISLGDDLNDLFKNQQSSGISVASHALVFMVCGVASKLKFSLGYFATCSATSGMLFPLLWRAIGYCGSYAGLKVISVVSDKASSNQKLYRIHQNNLHSVAYKTPNVFKGDQFRPLFFISDPPHLLKTARNNLANSGFNQKRLMWNQKDIIWKHVVDMYESDRQSPVRKLPKLTNEHIYLNPYSKMRVNLAAQVMSTTLGKVMIAYGPPTCSETAKFILIIDTFFDCCNVRSLTEGEHKRKPFLNPYRDINDERLEFLQKGFLKYLSDWKEATERRDPEQFNKQAQSKMFMSEATYQGFQTTANSIPECVKYLLSNGFDYVLTAKFSQDPLEDHFGRHRGLARRSNNPNIYSLGYQENKLRLERSIATNITPKGNTKGLKRRSNGITVTTSPLKRKKEDSEYI